MRALIVIRISLACAATGILVAGTPAFGQAHNPDDLQPGVNTSAMPAQAPAAASSAPASAPRTVAPNAAVPATTKPAGAAAAAKPAHGAKAIDRIDLDTTQITGNKELPKVMYVVPWKRSDLGDLTGKPANSLVDEVLQPVDRDVFNREERYYHTVAPQKGPAAPDPGAAAPH